MPNFEEMFLASEGAPVLYEGRLIQLVDEFPVESAQNIRVVRIGTNSKWKQGVHISTDGHFTIDGRNFAEAIVLWENTIPRTLEICVHSSSGSIFVKNVWDTGNGAMQSWHNGAAMIVDANEKTRTYRCNDGFADDDFDDLVFRIDLL